ncbi:MAG: CoA-binding protein [Candidatus Geothermincolia bacterium]
MQLRLDTLFRPESVAVVGVSLTNPFHPANIIFNKNFYRAGIRAYAVNPKGGEMERRPVYRSIGEIPDHVDVAVIAVQASQVLDVIRQCGEAGVDGAIVISGGFAEVGGAGVAYQDAMVAECRRHGITMIGPNCIGVFHPPHLDSFFLPPERTVVPKSGNISVVSQSGAFLVDQILTRFYEEDLGVRTAVSTGNRAMVDEVDLLQYFAEDDETRAICFYMEGVGSRPREFFELASQVTPIKPVIAYVGGKSDRGQLAAASHTAALAGNNRIVSAALEQCGVIEARDETELASLAKIFDFYHHRPLAHGDIAIITTSGGHGVIAADLCETFGLNPVSFDDAEQARLSELATEAIRGIASFADPIDLTGSASDQDFERTLDYVLGLERVEGAIVLVLPYTPSITSFVGTRLGHIVRRHDKPVAAYVPALAKYGMVLEGFELNGIPVVHTIAEAAQMMCALRRLGKTRRLNV